MQKFWGWKVGVFIYKQVKIWICEAEQKMPCSSAFGFPIVKIDFWKCKIQLAIVQKMYVDMFGCECGWVRVSVYPNYNVCHILSSLGRGKIVTDFSMGVQYIK